MKRILAAFAVASCGLWLPSQAASQGVTRVCVQSVNPTTGANNCVDATSSSPLPVTGNTTIPTYSAGVGSAANSSAGDVYCISGSATKTVYVKTVRVSAIASAAIADNVNVIKRSTADTGGTPTNVPLVPNDSSNPAGTATITTYGTAPTPGTTVGTIRSQVITIPTTSGAASPVPALFEFSNHWDQPIVLHGTAETLCLNVPATAGGQWAIDSEHTEQ